MKETTGFFAYPSLPKSIGETISRSVNILRDRFGITSFQPWEEVDVAGRFIVDEILNTIDSKDSFIADVTILNFNVTYEIGYAIGRGKRLLLTRNPAISNDDVDRRTLGIYDTLGYQLYENAEQLASLLKGIADLKPLSIPAGINARAPIFITDEKFQTDPITRIKARAKKARYQFRTFDPNEQSRMSAGLAINEVAQSYGVLVTLLPSPHEDAKRHNLRSAFVAGLAAGMEKALLILQSTDDPVPLDYQDLVTTCQHPEQIDEAIADFASEVAEAFQGKAGPVVDQSQTFLEKMSLGSSSAENEMRDLAMYYLQTDQFQRTLRGETRIVVGRKGSGKSAIFMQVRDKIRDRRTNIVVDLKPEGYKLIKFKEMVLTFLEEGTHEHTITAFWEYLLLLEVCYKLLEKDKQLHLRDHNLYEPYRQLAKLYETDQYVSEGDFSERMSRLLHEITGDYQAKYGGQTKVRLSEAEITDLLYKHNVSDLRREVVSYLSFKDSLWILIDNLDKGWPAHGLGSADLLIIRSLIESTRKLERDLQKHDIDAHAIVFIRNDVYELLVAETPDRGKEARVALDWTDPDLLREVIRLRIVANDLDSRARFEDIWPQVCVSHVRGEESSQYLVDRSLMRPRGLIDLINHCKSYAVNLRHTKIDETDVGKGLTAYSRDLLTEIGYEIKDVYSKAGDILYAFIGSKSTLPSDQMAKLLHEYHIEEDMMDKIIDILLWFGFLGVVRAGGEITYIYSVDYNISQLKGIIRKAQSEGLVYAINPAFWPSLEVVQ